MNVLVYDHEDENFQMLFNVLHKQMDINCDFCSFIPVNKTYDLVITDNEHLNNCSYIKNIPILVIGNQNDDKNDNIITISPEEFIFNNQDIMTINDPSNNCIYIKPPVFTNHLINIINEFKYNKNKNNKIINQESKIHLIDHRPKKIWFSFSLNPINNNIKYLRNTLLYYANIINTKIINSINLIIAQLIAENLLNYSINDVLSFNMTLNEDCTTAQFNNLNLKDLNLFFVNSQLDNIDFYDNKTIITWLA
jgi:hypothetical protein